MIRQFDVVPNPLRRERQERPYLVCIQHPLLDHLNSRIFAALVPVVRGKTATRLLPVVQIEGKAFHVDPTDLVTRPTNGLPQAIDNLKSDRDRIIAALDLVFTGI